MFDRIVMLINKLVFWDIGRTEPFQSQRDERIRLSLVLYCCRTRH